MASSHAYKRRNTNNKLDRGKQHQRPDGRRQLSEENSQDGKRDNHQGRD